MINGHYHPSPAGHAADRHPPGCRGRTGKLAAPRPERTVKNCSITSTASLGSSLDSATRKAFSAWARPASARARPACAAFLTGCPQGVRQGPRRRSSRKRSVTEPTTTTTSAAALKCVMATARVAPNRANVARSSTVPSLILASSVLEDEFWMGAWPGSWVEAESARPGSLGSWVCTRFACRRSCPSRGTGGWF